MIYRLLLYDYNKSNISLLNLLLDLFCFVFLLISNFACIYLIVLAFNFASF